MWRKVCWSEDATLLALAYSDGAVEVCDTIGRFMNIKLNYGRMLGKREYRAIGHIFWLFLPPCIGGLYELGVSASLLAAPSSRCLPWLSLIPLTELCLLWAYA